MSFFKTALKVIACLVYVPWRTLQLSKSIIHSLIRWELQRLWCYWWTYNKFIFTVSWSIYFNLLLQQSVLNDFGHAVANWVCFFTPFDTLLISCFPIIRHPAQVGGCNLANLQSLINTHGENTRLLQSWRNEGRKTGSNRHVDTASCDFMMLAVIRKQLSPLLCYFAANIELLLRSDCLHLKWEKDAITATGSCQTFPRSS